MAVCISISYRSIFLKFTFTENGSRAHSPKPTFFTFPKFDGEPFHYHLYKTAPTVSILKCLIRLGQVLKNGHLVIRRLVTSFSVKASFCEMGL